jgi:hypothetical protein
MIMGSALLITQRTRILFSFYNASVELEHGEYDLPTCIYFQKKHNITHMVHAHQALKRFWAKIKCFTGSLAKRLSRKYK